MIDIAMLISCMEGEAGSSSSEWSDETVKSRPTFFLAFLQCRLPLFPNA
jgi:hypothetical protein